MQLTPIGRVRTCFGEKFAVPRQPGLCPSAWGELRFEPEFRRIEAVRGLESFSHLWLVFGFHLTAGAGWKPTVRPPRLGGNERIGVFASRSTFRPNGLGLSLVALEEVDTGAPDGPLLRLGGVDLVDGTPVYDIKPYLPYAEARPEARGGYADEPPPRFEVVDDGLLDTCDERSARLIREVLSLDPRPAAGRNEPGRVHGALLAGQQVRFVVEAGRCRIVDLAPAALGD